MKVQVNKAFNYMNYIKFYKTVHYKSTVIKILRAYNLFQLYYGEKGLNWCL